MQGKPFDLNHRSAKLEEFGRDVRSPILDIFAEASNLGFSFESARNIEFDVLERELFCSWINRQASDGPGEPGIHLENEISLNGLLLGLLIDSPKPNVLEHRGKNVLQHHIFMSRGIRDDLNASVNYDKRKQSVNENLSSKNSPPCAANC